eukprot:295295-Prymnesium_polylepis.1
MTRKGREQSRGPVVPYRPAIPEPYVRKTLLGAPTYNTLLASRVADINQRILRGDEKRLRSQEARSKESL